jgi:hypothetical protein
VFWPPNCINWQCLKGENAIEYKAQEYPHCSVSMLQKVLVALYDIGCCDFEEG